MFYSTVKLTLNVGSLKEIFIFSWRLPFALSSTNKNYFFVKTKNSTFATGSSSSDSSDELELSEELLEDELELLELELSAGRPFLMRFSRIFCAIFSSCFLFSSFFNSLVRESLRQYGKKKENKHTFADIFSYWNIRMTSDQNQDISDIERCS